MTFNDFKLGQTSAKMELGINCGDHRRSLDRAKNGKKDYIREEDSKPSCELAVARRPDGKKEH
jgi:hypothetical protein